MADPTDARPGERAGGGARLPASLHALLFDRYADAVLVTDADGRYVEANLAATTLLGYSRAELLEMRVSDIVPSERTEAEFARFASEGYWRGEVEMRRKDGSIVTVESRATTAETAEGVWGVAILRDRGEPLEAALRATEGRLAAIVQSSQDAIYSIDVQGRIQTWNRGAERLFGWRAEEIVGRHVSVLAPAERRAELEENLERVLRGERIRIHETTRQRKDGARVEVELSVSGITDPDGTVTGVAAVAHDVSERREAERRSHVLYELTYGAGRAATEEEAFDVSLDALQRSIHTDRASVLTFDESGVMRFRAWRGLSAAYRAAVEGHTPWARDEPDPSPIHVPDVAADDSLADARPAILGEGIRALSFIPLLHRGRLLGKFMLYFDTPRSLPEIDLQMAVSIANQTAFALARLRAERALVQARAQLDLITVGSADGITIQDEDGTVVYANLAAARLSGFDTVEEFLVGAADYARRWEILDQDGRPFEAARLPGRRALAGEADPESVLHLRDRRTGREYWRSVRAKAAPGESGGPRYAINIFHDVTEQRRVQERLRFQAALLRAQAEASVEGILVVDPAGRIVSWNARFAEMWQIPDDVIASRSDDRAIESVLSRLVDPDGFRQRIKELYADPTAEAADEIELLDGRTFERVTRPLPDESGENVGRIWFFRDATDERRREAAHRMLADAGKVLASTFDDDRALESVAEVVLGWNAEIVSVYVARGEALRLVILRHADPARQPVADEILARFPVIDMSTNPAITSLAEGRSILIPEFSEEVLRESAGEGPLLDLVRGLGMTGAISVPIRSRGAVIGGLTVGRTDGRRYDDRDVMALEDLAERVARTLDNARLYRERDAIARTLQSSLLPTEIPAVPTLEIAERYRAAGEGIDVGGDFFDLFEVGDGSWAVAVGDVCGKGSVAASLTGVARHTLRAAAMMDPRPSRMLAVVNDAIMRESVDERFCTILLGRITPTPNGSVDVVLCAGGHPPALVLRADGSLEEIDEPGTLLGIFPDPHLPEVPVLLMPGDTMVLYTDGVTDEQSGGEEFGQARLHELVRSCAGLSTDAFAERIEREVEAFSDTEPRDDIAILVLRATG